MSEIGQRTPRQLVTNNEQQTRVIDPLLDTVTRVLTFEQKRPLTNASCFFFEREERLFLITSRHVLVDEPTGHYPNRLEIERCALPETTVYRAFTPDHLHSPSDTVEAGNPILIVGFPLSFHDSPHHMPVVRHAVVASSFGLRQQGRALHDRPHRKNNPHQDIR